LEYIVKQETMAPLVSIIIPNWNGRHHLEACLSSLRSQRYTDFEVILVDNDSSDGSQEFVLEKFPEVRLVELDSNQGFTGGCNAGVEVALGTFIVLLNNDTEADSNWLSSLVDAFGRNSDVGILASRIMLFDRRDHFHSAGDFYSVDGIPGNRGVWQENVDQYGEEEEVFSACGAAAAYRRSMIDEIGFLDDDFYFSCEDVDMGWRAHLTGWRVVYVPDAVIYHKLKATGGSVTGSYYDGRNFLYLIWKNYPWPLLRRNLIPIIRAQLRITRQALKSLRGEAARARLRGQFAGMMGIIRMLPERRRIQANRQLPDDALTTMLSPVDEKLGDS
jgi:GT2 family glycosyltransferase